MLQRKRSEVRPVARFFDQFAASRLDRRLAALDHAGRYLPEIGVDRMPVLLDQDDFLRRGTRDDAERLRHVR